MQECEGVGKDDKRGEKEEDTRSKQDCAGVREERKVVRKKEEMEEINKIAGSN